MYQGVSSMYDGELKGKWKGGSIIMTIESIVVFFTRTGGGGVLNTAQGSLPET